MSTTHARENKGFSIEIVRRTIKTHNLLFLPKIDYSQPGWLTHCRLNFISWDALWGIAGMLVGAALFAEVYPALKNSVLTWGDFGKITLEQATGIHHWILIPVFIGASLALFKWFEKKAYKLALAALASPRAVVALTLNCAP